MRHIIITLSFLFSVLFVNAQTAIVDTNISRITAIEIEPVMVFFNDTVPASRLGVRIVSDNLKNRCYLYYELLDSSGNLRGSGNLTIDGETYQGWDGSNEFPFLFAASKLGLTIKLEE